MSRVWLRDSGAKGEKERRKMRDRGEGKAEGREKGGMVVYVYNTVVIGEYPTNTVRLLKVKELRPMIVFNSLFSTQQHRETP